MKLSEALGDVSLLGVDTSPFIYLVGQHSGYIDRVRAVFELIAGGHPAVVTSVITLSEVLPVPLEKGQEHFAQAYRDMLLNTRYVTTRPVDVETSAGSRRTTKSASVPLDLSMGV